MQVWFCPTRLNQCVLKLRAKWILSYSNIPNKSLVKSETSLTQAKVTSLELRRFVLEDGKVLMDSTLAPIIEGFDNKDPTNVDVISCKVSKNVFFCPLGISL